ncbi:MAG: FIG00996362: hypothetical protein [uncultured Nocardioidaceae bacterium]|uniref:DUF2252 domain-containing protein n=1 Tax=uncultured Nocardioidaceae bacterium TaxID=253824 RepID=A0A6J4MM02_9ACTN|nr:MAG: FIG00996362: hypothetical protein [uncultured Nocardioidaceae bacterium]
MSQADEQRSQRIIEVLTEAFAPLMESDPAAFRVKYRKMAMDPFAFYRGSAPLFYADVTGDGRWGESWADDEWVNEQSSAIWIHGDLHAENFGTYMNSDGRLVFDVNDFDEAYIGHYTWDLQRFTASLALMAWRKALPEKDVRAMVGRYLRGYLAQVSHYITSETDDDFGLYLDNTEGPVWDLLQKARLKSRIAMLDKATSAETGVRLFREGSGMRHLGRSERRKIDAAFAGYLETIPESKRIDRRLFYDVRDIVGKSGFGIGSAGLPAYNVLVEGFNQSLDNDVVLSMKQANVPAVSRFVDRSKVESYFDNEAHRTAVSQRALQSHTDPLLGWTTVDGIGYVVSEISPYEVDLDWGELNEPDAMSSVAEQLGRATAKIHCASDEDSDQTLVGFQVEKAVADGLQSRRKAFVAAVTEFALEYATQVRRDHALFVDAFRSGRIGISST